MIFQHWNLQIMICPIANYVSLVILLLCTVWIVVSFSSALVNNGLNARSKKTDDILAQTLQENVILCVYVSLSTLMLLASSPWERNDILLLLPMPLLLLDWHLHAILFSLRKEARGVEAKAKAQSLPPLHSTTPTAREGGSQKRTHPWDSQGFFYRTIISNLRSFRNYAGTYTKSVKISKNVSFLFSV